MKYSFKPSVGMTLAMLVTVAVCIKLGSWQYHKAQSKQALQQQLEMGLLASPVALPPVIDDIEKWRYRRVKFSGEFAPQYQVLLDNQVDNTVVGYHVLTPVKLEEANQYVLVNRGWVAGNLNRQLPAIKTPIGRQEFVGDIFNPLANYFTLESAPPTDGKWQQVWQHIDMQRYIKSVPFELKPYIVRLDAKSPVGGFSRNWPAPGNRVITHLGYAYQWFGFALTLFVIYIVLNFKKVKR